MSKTLKLFCVMICAILAIGIATAQMQRAKPGQERTVFSPSYNDSFDDSVPPSEELLGVLLDTKEAKEVLKNRPDLDPNKLASHFRVVKVHLADSKEVDYLVVGGGLLSGADCDWFWLVRSSGTHLKAVLFANTNSFELLKSRTNGLRNIRTDWSSAAGYTLTDIYHYDGARYRLARHFETRDKQTP